MDKSQELILWLDQLSNDDVPLVGGKNASLGEMISNPSALGVCVPGGFATTATAYRRFFRHGGLAERINQKLADLDINDVVALADAGADRGTDPRSGRRPLRRRPARRLGPSDRRPTRRRGPRPGVGAGLGLDEASISTERGFEESELLLGKRIGEDLYVKYVIGLLDGLQNVLPAGTPRFTQTNSSNLVDALELDTTASIRSRKPANASIR